jgi:putative DNA primase/helicase
MAYAVATGGRFLKWQAPQPQNVLYVDGEMPGRLLQERLDAILAGTERIPPDWDKSFRLLAMDTQDIGLSLNLANPSDQKRLDDKLDDTNLLVLDNLSTLVHGGRENDAESWDAMQAWLLQLRRRGISVLLVHHAGRSDNARGTSKREDVLDTVIHLKQPDDYQTEEGARFEVHLTKARGVHGDDASPFEAKLTVQDGAAIWSVRDIKDVEADQVAELSEAGSSVRDIAEETGMSKSKVNRIQKRLKVDGRL